MPQLTWIDAFKDQLTYAQTLADLIQNGNISDKVGAIAAAANQIPNLGLAGQADITNLTSLIGDASTAVSSTIDSIAGGLF